MPDVKAIYNQGARGYQSAMVEVEARFRQAQLDDDITAATEAAMQMNNLRVAMQSWDGLYADAQRQQRPAAAQVSKYGLTSAETEIARGIGGTARGLTNEQREQIYAQQKARYLQARADGSYRDDQGRVTR